MATNPTSFSPEYLAQSKTGLVTAFYSIPIALEASSTAWRLWAVSSSQKRLGFEDYLMLWATLCSMVECALGLVYGPPYGLGRHIQALPEHDVQMFLKGDYIFSHFYDIAIGFTKLSVLALYHRIFITRTFRTLVISTACFVCAWIIVMEVVLGFGCRPIQAWWDETQGKCIDKESFTYFTNITNMATDLWIFSMPIPVILGLHAAKERRIILCVMFGIGAATCAISAARLSFVFGVASADFTWDEASLGILSAWEPCGAILCANLPHIYRHLVFIKDKIQTTVKSVTNSRRSAITSGSEQRGGGYKGSLQHHDWAKLNNSDGLSGGTGGETVIEIVAQPLTTTVELDELKSEGIMVSRAFTQSSAHDLLSAAAAAAAAAAAKDKPKDGESSC